MSNGWHMSQQLEPKWWWECMGSVPTRVKGLELEKAEEI